ncbi:hypothetical protein NB568_17170 [Vibrio alginolyticus]|uniref:hypothetical protein n=1 Tax=Vibrio harveyi group TaxID=717610 RepID=UPI00111CD9B2|nr:MULTISPECIES: hypothetical protein [Vibrio harveyi group]HDY7661572.1 hypothetical protein [Vibrio vulnificus]MBE3992663.1 hypothetical protein [Vibrio parahaemolyticus]MCR9851761.1 hypothetical protein [Vibrio parahaemolyticus]MCR9904490.1 hypothetical protein [Vibrio alginolyticus]TOJ89530.1 hypothetical protein CGI30_09940 [Vibrio parahaemolyticus]
MRILYLDLHALLYSIDYLNKHEDVFDSFKSQKPFCSTDTLLGNVEPDRAGAQKLAQAARKANLLLYPTGTSYTRESLVKHNVFPEPLLAPYVDVTSNVRLDDHDPVRCMFAHANVLKAEWFVCGDIASDERFKSFPNRYLVSKFDEGVSDGLISQIIATKAC